MRHDDSTYARPIHRNRLRRWIFELGRNREHFVETARRRGLPRAIQQAVFSRGFLKLLLISVLAIVTVWYVAAHRPELFSSEATPTQKRTRSTQSQTPTFDTVLPSGKSIKSLGGWHRVSPHERAPAFAYSDTIGDVKLVVTQQQLPDDFRNDPEERVKQLANSADAKHEIKTNDSIAFLGSNEQGIQQVFLTKNRLLILIKTTDRISDQEWTEYISDLR